MAPTAQSGQGPVRLCGQTCWAEAWGWDPRVRWMGGVWCGAKQRTPRRRQAGPSTLWAPSPCCPSSLPTRRVPARARLPRPRAAWVWVGMGPGAPGTRRCLLSEPAPPRPARPPSVGRSVPSGGPVSAHPEPRRWDWCEPGSRGKATRVGGRN